MASNEGISPSIIAAGKYTPGVTSQQGLSAICEVLTGCHVALTCLPLVQFTSSHLATSWKKEEEVIRRMQSILWVGKATIMMGSKERYFAPLIHVSLKTLVPTDHPACW